MLLCVCTDQQSLNRAKEFQRRAFLERENHPSFGSRRTATLGVSREKEGEETLERFCVFNMVQGKSGRAF